MPVKEVLGKYSKEQIKKAAQIKAIFFDVDGVLTDGGLLFSETGETLKRFNTLDSSLLLMLSSILISIPNPSAFTFSKSTSSP